MNPYLSVLVARPPAGARYAERGGPRSTRAEVSPRYGAVLSTALVAYAAGRYALSAAAGAYQESLNRAYNLDGALRVEEALKEVEAARAGTPLASFQVGVPASAWRVPASLGDAKVKGAYWAARAARLAPGMQIEAAAQAELESLDGADYDIRDPRAISARLRAVEEQVLRAATLRPPAADAGEVDPRVRPVVGPAPAGKVPVFRALSDLKGIEDTQGRKVAPTQAAEEMLTQTAPDALIEETAQRAEGKAREIALQAARDWRKANLPGFILDDQGDIEKWVLPTAGVAVVGAFLLARQGRRQELELVASIARDRR